MQYRSCKLLVAACLAWLSISPARAQPPRFQPATTVAFDKLVRAQIIQKDGDNQLVMTVETYLPKRESVAEPESRIRLDTADDKTLLLKFKEPRAVVHKNVVTSITVLESQEMTVAANDVRFYKLSGVLISPEEVAGILADRQPLFLLDDFQGEKPIVPRVYSAALSTDTLIAVTPRKIREVNQANLKDHRVGPIRKVPDPLKPENIKNTGEVDAEEEPSKPER